MRQGDYPTALSQLAEAESQNGKFADIQALKAAAFRHSGEHEKALAATARALELDPMHFMGGYEKTLAETSLKKPAALAGCMEFDHARRRAELPRACVLLCRRGALRGGGRRAAAYAKGKDPSTITRWSTTCADISSRSREMPPPQSLFRQGGERACALRESAPARREGRPRSGSCNQPGGCRRASLPGQPSCAMGQREEGFAHWKKATEANPKLSLAWRNVAYAENLLRKDLKASYQAYTRTMELAPDDARALLEKDQVAERLKTAASERLASLERHRTAVDNRDDLVARVIDLRLQIGGRQNFDAAYGVLKSRHFHSWEGDMASTTPGWRSTRSSGTSPSPRRDYAGALARYQEACDYPKNLEVAARTPDFRAHVFWNLARVHLEMGKTEEARGYLSKILAEKYPQAAHRHLLPGPGPEVSQK